MEVTVKLFSDMPENRYKIERGNLAERSRVIDVFNQFEIPPEEVTICMVNDQDASYDQILQSGDTLSLFPPVGGS